MRLRSTCGCVDEAQASTLVPHTEHGFALFLDELRLLLRQTPSQWHSCAGRTYIRSGLGGSDRRIDAHKYRAHKPPDHPVRRVRSSMAVLLRFLLLADRP